MAGALKHVQMHPAQVKTGPVPQRMKAPGVGARDHGWVLFQPGPRPVQRLDAEGLPGVLIKDRDIPRVHPHVLKLPRPHGMIHMAMGEQHHQRLAGEAPHHLAQAAEPAPCVDQGGALAAFHQVHEFVHQPSDAHELRRKTLYAELFHKTLPAGAFVMQAKNCAGQPEIGKQNVLLPDFRPCTATLNMEEEEKFISFSGWSFPSRSW